MYLSVLPAITADGSDQAVVVPRGAALIIRPVTNDAYLRSTAGSTEYLTLDADTPFSLGRFDGQTIYLRATAGTVIQQALA